MAIFVIRHGETDLNAARVFQRPETPLSERGRRQAALLAIRLQPLGITRIVTSDLARALQLDVTNQSSIAAAAERIRKEFGRLDVLVNNAAISHAGKPGRSLEEIAKSGRLSVVTLDEVRAVFEANVFGTMAVTRRVLPHMRRARRGRVVTITSVAGMSSGGSFSCISLFICSIRSLSTPSNDTTRANGIRASLSIEANPNAETSAPDSGAEVCVFLEAVG